MTKPLLAILLLLPLSVSAGELDGKGIICVNTDERYKGPFGVEFKNDVALKWVVLREGTVAKLQLQYPEEIAGKYRTSTTVVNWWNVETDLSDPRYVLNRKTLVLEYKGVSGFTLALYNCVVSPSLDAFRETLELARLNLQTEIEASTKDNKI